MISIISLIISIVAVVAAIGTVILQVISNHAQIKRNQKDINAVFANLWIELDQMFIEHPNMHKYFYAHDIKKDDSPLSGQPEAVPEEDYELAICIAERIVDVFQYAELFKDSLNTTDRESYEQFKKRFFSSEFMEKVVKPIWENNGSSWIIH